MFSRIFKVFNSNINKMEPLHYLDIPSEKATFSMGCFWAPDSLFGSTPGIITTRVGYAGGTEGLIPTYRNIGDYTEAIQLQYDPNTVSYLELLKMFWDHHDPTAKFKKQYSSFIYYHNDQQKAEAELTLNEKKSKGLDVLTKIEPAGQFFNAEDYHQKYRLQQHKNLCNDLGLKTGDDLINSHVAARLNGYVVGQGGIDQFDSEVSKLRLDEAAISYIRQLVIKYEDKSDESCLTSTIRDRKKTLELNVSSFYYEDCTSEEHFHFQLYGMCHINLRQLLILTNSAIGYLVIQILFKLNK